MSILWSDDDPREADPTTGPVALCVALVSAGLIGAGFLAWALGVPVGMVLLIVALAFSAFVFIDEIGSGLWRG